MGKKIVLGDRKSLAQIAYKGTLERAGYEVVGVATGGMELLHMAQELKPDLVMSSVCLDEPGGDVLTVARLLMDSDPTTAVLLYAGAGVCTRADCQQAGARGFFEYPARADEMLAEVRRVIG